MQKVKLSALILAAIVLVKGFSLNANTPFINDFVKLQLVNPYCIKKNPAQADETFGSNHDSKDQYFFATVCTNLYYSPNKVEEKILLAEAWKEFNYFYSIKTDPRQPPVPPPPKYSF